MPQRKYIEAALTVLACIALVAAVLVLCSCTLTLDRDGFDWRLHYPRENNAAPQKTPTTRPTEEDVPVPLAQ